jgi:NAD(P)-dependent dehydrogenase (short-subunit alcohol dehydrogenase family)
MSASNSVGAAKQTWFITGVSKGIGKEIALAALAAGHTVIGTGRVDAPAELKSTIHYLKLDVDDVAQVKQVVAQAIKLANGKVDVVVNNSGWVLSGAIEEVTIEQVKAQYATNVFGALAVTQAFLPHLRQHKSGHIIQISSLLGRVSGAGWGLYSSTKWALESLSEALAEEVKPFGIKVTLAEPGFTRTPILASGSVFGANALPSVYDGIRPSVKELNALNGSQAGDPARIGRAIVQVTALPSPPLHLPLGSDAFYGLQAGLKKIIDEVEELKAISVSTDFPK